MFSLIPWRKESRNELATPSQPFESIRREFTSLFDRFFGDWPTVGWEGSPWGLTLEDRGADVYLRAEAPGFNAAEFDVQLCGDTLHITAEHREEGGDNDTPKRWSRFARTVTLPAGLDPDKIDARYLNGVLEVTVGKTPESQPRRIAVKA